MWQSEAISHLEAAVLLFSAPPRDPEFLHFLGPRGLLLNHSLELALKSFCLFNGAALEELRRAPLGHDLEALLKFAEDKGLNNWTHISSADRAELEKWNSDNVADRDYRYGRRYPHFEKMTRNDEFIRDFSFRVIQANGRQLWDAPSEHLELEFDPYGYGWQQTRLESPKSE